MPGLPRVTTLKCVAAGRVKRSTSRSVSDWRRDSGILLKGRFDDMWSVKHDSRLPMYCRMADGMAVVERDDARFVAFVGDTTSRRLAMR